MIEQAKQIGIAVTVILGGISMLSTLLAHVVPWPPVAAFFARIGFATSRFAVVQK